MVRPVSSSTIPHPATRPTSPATSTETAPDVGHPRDRAIGQQAKAAIAMAGEGADLPKNIQGKVASALARSLPLDTILNLQEASEPGGDVPIDPIVDDPIVDDPVVADPVVDDPIAGEPAGEDAVVGVLLDTPDLTEPAAEPEPEVAPIELPVPEDLMLDPELTDPPVDGGNTDIT